MITPEYQNSNERSLKNRWHELKNRKDELLKTRCTELKHIPDGFNLSQTNCQYITVFNGEYCKTSCSYYKDKIQPIVDEMDQIQELNPSFLK
ncbi:MULTISPECIES: hypothetical protein [Anaerostipes]|uniref:hypothetical protein n=1 Tax=Anaerostipes TaxID=207244 RepID=UPI000950CE0C|nr:MULTISPECIES: hypothetical protein [unclassified Anaerostipes]MCI5623354.1 hypothetical protein [Anaerostipes sp.]MDY2727156.1 hypothetical protein [Anaerostipes faecalis]OLR58357.1 hypothetical protein BHF70_01190 [Anaerostipes sp. 494a]